MTRLRPDWDGLQRGIAGQVVLPGSAAYERACPPFIAGFDDHPPRAVVGCANPQDVGQALAVARRGGLDVAVRSGGHCFAGFSSTRGVVIDVTPMRSPHQAPAVTRAHRIPAVTRLRPIPAVTRAHRVPAVTRPPQRRARTHPAGATASPDPSFSTGRCPARPSPRSPPPSPGSARRAGSAA